MRYEYDLVNRYIGLGEVYMSRNEEIAILKEIAELLNEGTDSKTVLAGVLKNS